MGLQKSYHKRDQECNSEKQKETMLNLWEDPLGRIHINLRLQARVNKMPLKIN